MRALTPVVYLLRYVIGDTLVPESPTGSIVHPRRFRLVGGIEMRAVDEIIESMDRGQAGARSKISIVGDSFVAEGLPEIVVDVRRFRLIGGIEMNALQEIVKTVHRDRAGSVGAPCVERYPLVPKGPGAGV